MNKKCVMVIDTEATGIIPMDNPIPKYMRTYDVGFQVREKRSGLVLLEKSFVVSDVFYNGPQMDNAYFRDKIPAYKAGIGSKWQVARFGEIRDTVNAVVRTFGIREIWAYNVAFDRVSLDATTYDLSNGVVSKFVDSLVEWLDIWPLAQVITGTRAYCDWAVRNGYVTATGTPKTNVETVGKWLYGATFGEEHTGLSDVRDESLILSECLKRGAKKPTCEGQGYRAALRWAKKTGHYIPPNKRQGC